MILEGLMTTENDDGTANVSPMGPRVDESLTSFVLRPFRTSTTYRNLKRSGVGVFHVTDDVELLARAAIGKLDPPPPLRRATSVQGFVLTDACRWFELRVDQLADDEERTTIVMSVVASGDPRPFFGLNRAKHAVVEGAILATRLHLLPQNEVLAQLSALRPLVDKTGGPAEHRAFATIEEYVRRHGIASTEAADADASRGMR